MKIYDVSRLPPVITLGYDGENNWRQNRFDCSSLLTNHPNGVITLWLLPKGESQAFPVAVQRDGNVIVWTPLNEEMTTEYGSLQIQCDDGTDVGKSDTAQYHVKGSLVSGAAHPATMPSWAARVVEATGHYPKIINGNWYVWDVQNGEWSDTGVSAGGDVSPEQIAEAIEEYFDEHPIQAPVQSVNGKTGAVNLSASDVHALPDSYTPPVESVNGKTGAVVLDAEDVGALPDDTVIPTAVTEQDVAGWGFTKNTGTYSKPSGGIPASDLASGVIPAVPQMATQTDMSDWTSGKTVDAATLKTNFTVAVQNLINIGNALDTHSSDIIDLQNNKADKTEIPTKTSDLTDDSGFQTATQVNTAISTATGTLQTKSITDTGNYYTTDTVEGALQEIGAELAGVNTLIGSGVIT